MELTKKEIQKLRPQGNMVLVKLDRLPDQLILKSGKVIFIDPSFDEEKHAVVTGEVIAVPENLIFGSDPNSMPWETDMELKVGDQAIFYYMASYNAFQSATAKWLKDEDDNTYIFVKYEHFYVAKRKKKIIPLNGYCIIEPVDDTDYEELEKQFRGMGLEVPDHVKNKISTKFGIVKYLGKPNRGYKFFDPKSKVRDTDHGCDIKVGDKIVMKKVADIPLEYEYHATLEGRKKFFRVQRRYITGLAG